MFYTYLIGWSAHNKWYYGRRTSKYCKNTTELWTTYFTSSKKVAQFRKQYGEPDIVEVRKVCPSREYCIKLETRILKYLKVSSNINWLNQREGDQGCTAYTTRIRSEESRKRDSEQKIQKYLDSKGFTIELLTEAISPLVNDYMPASQISKLLNINYRWVSRLFPHTRTVEYKTLSQKHIRTPEYRDKKRKESTGRIASLEKRQKCREAHLGKPKKETHKQHMRAARLKMIAEGWLPSVTADSIEKGKETKRINKKTENYKKPKPWMRNKSWFNDGSKIYLLDPQDPKIEADRLTKGRILNKPFI